MSGPTRTSEPEPESRACQWATAAAAGGGLRMHYYSDARHTGLEDIKLSVKFSKLQLLLAAIVADGKRPSMLLRVRKALHGVREGDARSRERRLEVCVVGFGQAAQFNGPCGDAAEELGERRVALRVNAVGECGEVVPVELGECRGVEAVVDELQELDRDRLLRGRKRRDEIDEIPALGAARGGCKDASTGLARSPTDRGSTRRTARSMTKPDSFESM